MIHFQKDNRDKEVKIELRHFRNKRSKRSKRYIIAKCLREGIEDKSNYAKLPLSSSYLPHIKTLKHTLYTPLINYIQSISSRILALTETSILGILSGRELRSLRDREKERITIATIETKKPRNESNRGEYPRNKRTKVSSQSFSGVEQKPRIAVILWRKRASP